MKQLLIKLDPEKVFLDTKRTVTTLKKLYNAVEVRRISNEQIYLIEFSPENSFLQKWKNYKPNLAETAKKYLRPEADSEDEKIVIAGTKVIEENRLFFIEPIKTRAHGILNNKLWGQNQIRLPKAKEILPPELRLSMPIGIATIDTGIYSRHPALQSVIWRASEEFIISLDGKSLAFPVGSFGFNVFESKNKNKRGTPEDNHYHGTMVAGIIGAKGIGVARAYEHQFPIKLLAVKGFEKAPASDSALGDTDTVIKSLDFIIEARKILKDLENPIDLRIVNLSFGYFRKENLGFSLILEQKIKQAADEGILFISATGNERTDLDVTDNEQDWEFYPAGIDCDGMIAVAAIKENGELWEFSNYGRKNVHIAAPGYDIYSTTLNDNYIYGEGTSLAAPFVSASAALLLLTNPLLQNLEIKTRLMDKADQAPALAVQSSGSLDLYNSLQGAF